MESTRDISTAKQSLSGDIPALNATLSAGLIGLFVGLIFYGIMLCQTYHYFRTYNNDAPTLKVLVVMLIVAETIHTVLSIHWGYFYFIKNFANPEAYTTPTLSLALLPSTVVLIIILSQLFYIRRVYLILPPRYGKIFLILAMSLAMCSVGFATALTVQIFLHGTFKQWLQYRWLVSAAYGPPAAGDVLVATVLVFALHRSHTGIKRTDVLLGILKVYGFSTGLVTSLLSTACLLVDITEGTNLFIIPFSLTSANVYAFSMLVTLNMRQGLAEQLDKDDIATEWLGLSALRCTTQPQDTKLWQAPVDESKTLNDTTATGDGPDGKVSIDIAGIAV